MNVITKEIAVSTGGNTDIIDITKEASALVSKSGIQNGTITLFVPGSTAGLTTIEYEPGLIKDLPETFEEIAPSAKRYHHDDTWGDGNGHAHVRAALLGPSLTVPFVRGKLTLGTWQQIVLIDFDNRSRQRRIVVQIMGD
ncbi:MAG: YjbQ family protein [Actinobacteria bacterium]|nr:YjbQ family protein [Actinomycetota bacterium]